jgi:glycosyltransferase involved in cell wall biosynthesis
MALAEPDMEIPTSVGPLRLTGEEHGLVRRLLAGEATLDEGQRLYHSTTSRGLPFPMEWEVHVLKAALAEFPDREDLVERLAHVEVSLSRGSGAGAAAMDRENWTRAWASFASTSLAGLAYEELQRRRVRCFSDACTLLAGPHFTALPLDRRVATILALRDTLMAVPSQDLTIVAELGLRQFRALLEDEALTEPQAMSLYDALHGMYFAGVSDVADLRRFDVIVPAFEQFLVGRLGEHVDDSPVALSAQPRTIGYLLHTAHFERGNAVSPLIVSLADMHARMPDRRVILYLVEYIGSDFLEEVEGQAFSVRSFPQGRDYGRLREIAAAIREDGVDVLVTEQNRAIAATLFVRRVAPVQMWIDTGFPFWSLASLDWTLSPSAERPARPGARRHPLAWRQHAATLRREVGAEELASARGAFPDDAFVLGVFVRLVKLSEPFLDLLARLLASEPSFHVLVAGTGDPSRVMAFLGERDHARRVVFMNHNVDLDAYAQVVDVMCDTFPFIGGNACREVAAHGTPVVSMLGTPWDAVLREDRSPDLLAADAAAYIEAVRRLRRDEAFMSRQRKIAIELFRRQTDPARMLEDVEAGISAAVAARRN